MDKPYGHNKLIFQHYLSKVLTIERSLLFSILHWIQRQKLGYITIDTIVHRNTNEIFYEFSDTHNARFDRKILRTKTLCSCTDRYLTHTWYNHFKSSTIVLSVNPFIIRVGKLWTKCRIERKDLNQNTTLYFYCEHIQPTFSSKTPRTVKYTYFWFWILDLSPRSVLN